MRRFLAHKVLRSCCRRTNHGAILTSNRWGYSFAELLIAFFVLAVALLGTVAALHYSVQGANHGTIYTEASANARAILEVMLSENRAFSTASLPPSNSGFNDAAGVTRPLNEAPFALNEYRFSSSSRFRRRIEIREYTQVSDNAAARAWKNDLRQVTVTLFWTESNRQRSLSLVSLSRKPR